MPTFPRGERSEDSEAPRGVLERIGDDVHNPDRMTCALHRARRAPCIAEHRATQPRAGAEKVAPGFPAQSRLRRLRKRICISRSEIKKSITFMSWDRFDPNSS
jgi:hypothetical protein